MKGESQAAGQRTTRPEASLGREARAEICAQVAQACRDAFAGSLRALVLTGSLARDEATIVPAPKSFQLLGDAEFLVVFHDGHRLPSAESLRRAREAAESALRTRGILCPVDLSAVHQVYFERLEPNIFAYELMTCGEVICGDPGILHEIPAFAAKDITLEDAWRLLCNRIIELLGCADDLESGVPSKETRYRVAKLYLDMATSLLVFVGAYEPTYGARAEALRQLNASQRDKKGEFPFLLQEFSKEISALTEWKLSAGDSEIDLTADRIDAAISYARLLWQWEMSKLTESSGQVSNAMLMARWNQMQPLSQRVRGWVHVARRCGWLRSIGHWPLWASRARKASPRHWVYAAAVELVFRLPCLLGRGGKPLRVEMDWEQLRRTLPFVPDAISETRSGWRRLAADIVWNYREFLVGTRS